MGRKDDMYIQAFSYSSLTPVYDSLMKYAMRESIFKNRLANQVRLGKGRMALDLGCETATLTISIEKTFPEAEVVGVDIARAITLSRALVFVSPEQCT